MAKDSLFSADELLALRNEVKLSEKFNEKELEPRIMEAIERYTGLHLPTIALDWSIVLNEVYPVVQHYLPNIFFRNPRVFLKPRNKFFIGKRRNLQAGGQLEDTQMDATKSARTQEAILNYKIDKIHYKEETRKTLLDALLFPYGVMWHGYKGSFGMTAENSYFIRKEDIFVLRIPPPDFLYDPSVSIENIEQARWTGRRFWVRLTDIVEDKALNIDKSRLKGITGFGNKVGRNELVQAMLEAQKGGGDIIQLGAGRMKPLIDFAEDKFKASPRARFIRLYELYVRPTPQEEFEGKRGRIALLTFEQPELLRENRWVPNAEGWPGQVLQFNPVPDQKIGLADIEVYGPIADHKNLVVNQQIRNAEQTNKVWVGISKDAAVEEDIEKARRGENTIIRFDTDKVSDRMFVSSAGGGGSQELYLLDQRIDQNLQDKSGINDLKRGVLRSGEESKFSVQQRTLGANARPAYRQDIMAGFIKQSTLYLNDLLKQFFPVKEAVRIIGSLDIQWTDDFTKEDIQADVDVELDVTSMAPENPEQEIKELTTILNLMTQSITNPQIQQKLLQENRLFNLAPVIENLLLRLKIRDPEVFRTIRPEESEGFVSVSEVKTAQANVQAALANQAPPSPPAEGQDHRARLEVYGSIAQLIEQLGFVSDVLNELITTQIAIAQAESEKTAPKVPKALKSPKVFQKAGGLQG